MHLRKSSDTLATAPLWCHHTITVGNPADLPDVQPITFTIDEDTYLGPLAWVSPTRGADQFPCESATAACDYVDEDSEGTYVQLRRNEGKTTSAIYEVVNPALGRFNYTNSLTQEVQLLDRGVRLDAFCNAEACYGAGSVTIAAVESTELQNESRVSFSRDLHNEGQRHIWVSTSLGRVRLVCSEGSAAVGLGKRGNCGLEDAAGTLFAYRPRLDVSTYDGAVPTEASADSFRFRIKTKKFGSTCSDHIPAPDGTVPCGDDDYDYSVEARVTINIRAVNDYPTALFTRPNGARGVSNFPTIFPQGDEATPATFNTAALGTVYTYMVVPGAPVYRRDLTPVLIQARDPDSKSSLTAYLLSLPGIDEGARWFRDREQQRVVGDATLAAATFNEDGTPVALEDDSLLVEVTAEFATSIRLHNIDAQNGIFQGRLYFHMPSGARGQDGGIFGSDGAMRDLLQFLAFDSTSTTVDPTNDPLGIFRLGGVSGEDPEETLDGKPWWKAVLLGSSVCANSSVTPGDLDCPNINNIVSGADHQVTVHSRLLSSLPPFSSLILSVPPSPSPSTHFTPPLHHLPTPSPSPCPAALLGHHRGPREVPRGLVRGPRQPQHVPPVPAGHLSLRPQQRPLHGGRLRRPVPPLRPGQLRGRPGDGPVRRLPSAHVPGRGGAAAV